MKQGEIDYLKNAGDDYAAGAYDKPFAEEAFAKNMIGLSLIMTSFPCRPARVLDLGCGTGWTSWMMAKCGYEVIGQDISPDMIALANRNAERYGVPNVSFTISDYESLGFVDEFDAAVFYDSLHHAEDPQAAIDCAFRALRKGGVLVTHEPGIGHSRHPASIDAMARWGVSEKDMPPTLIFRMGRKAGFTRCRRIIDPTPLFRAVYQVNIDLARPETGFGARMRNAVNVVRKLLDPRQGAICILTK